MILAKEIAFEKWIVQFVCRQINRSKQWKKNFVFDEMSLIEFISVLAERSVGSNRFLRLGRQNAMRKRAREREKAGREKCSLRSLSFLFS